MEHFKKETAIADLIQTSVNILENPESYKSKLQDLDKETLQAYFCYLLMQQKRNHTNNSSSSTFILNFGELVDLITTQDGDNAVTNCILYDIFQVTCHRLDNHELFSGFVNGIAELNNSNLKLIAFLTGQFPVPLTQQIINLLIKHLFGNEMCDKNLIIDCLRINFERVDHIAVLEHIVKSHDNVFILNGFCDELIAEGSVLRAPKFWNYLRDCIKQDDNKYAVNILKEIVKHFKTADSNFEFDNYFAWSATLCSAHYNEWSSFLLILENLHEKQNHLIMPTLKLVGQLNYVSKFWLFALLEKLLQHNNNTVIDFGINYILEHYDVVDVIDDESKLLDKLLIALNNHYLYAYDYNSQLGTFFRNRPHAIFSNLANFNYNSITLYNFLNIFHNNIARSWSDPNLILNLVKTVKNCQNLTIRSVCQIMVVKILNQTWPNYSFNELLNLIENALQIIDNKYNILLYFDRDVTVLQDYKSIIELASISIGTKIKIIEYLYKLNVIDGKHLAAILNENNENLEFILNFIVANKPNLENINLNNFYSNPIVYTNAKYLELLFKIEFNLNAIKWPPQYDDLTTIKLISDHINYAQNPDIYRAHTNFLNQCNPKTCDLKMFCCLQNNLLKISVNNNYDHVIYNSLELLEIADKTNLMYIFETIEIVVSAIDESNMDKLFLLIDRSYREIVALRKNEYYWILIKKFVKLIFINGRGIEHRIWRESIVEKYVDTLLGEARQTNGLGYTLYKNLLIINEDTLVNWPKFADYLINGLIFGETMMKREQVLEGKIMKSILGQNSNLNIKSHYSYETNSKIRALCITFLFKVRKLNHLDFLAQLTRHLVTESLALGKSKPRYYAYSQHHRVKLRIVQAIAILFTMNKSNFCHSDFILTTLQTENNQTNITILLELLAAELISCGDLLTYIKSLNTISPSKITTFLIITYLKCLKDNNLVLCENTIKLFLHWTMAQHFQTRLYAQITIMKLIEHFSLTADQKYCIIYENIVECLKYGNYDVNSKKLLNDFRFGCANLNFHNLLSLETVFCNVPRITEMPEEEIININLIKLAGLYLDYNFDDSNNYEYDGSLDLVDVITSNSSSTNTVVVENEIEIEQTTMDANFQKKIVVQLKQTVPKTMELFNYETDDDEGLIVIASLVTRSPNLGGLARTCEIFGVKKYVLDSLKHTETKEFQALSVTAEKWLTLEEVKSHHVKQYLTMMKQKGYTVIGAEQTSNSISIEKIKFPKKSIILLGNEKEGVPANLISMFDITAEIPQFGVVRSLNVHVTGAIFMWEYAKQHLVINL